MKILRNIFCFLHTVLFLLALLIQHTIITFSLETGTILNVNVIYCKFSEGPFKGKFNGERRYQVDFTDSSRTMGTYHFLDGAKIRVFYRGNTKTCGRCHKTARDCLGAGIARECEDQGGVRVHLADHMKHLWAEIDFNPTSFELPDSDDTDGDKHIVQGQIFQRPEQVTQNSDLETSQ